MMEPLTAKEFCDYFEFSIVREEGIDDDGKEYRYVVYDNCGTLADRYVYEVKELPEKFSALMDDYVIDDLLEMGYETDEKWPSFDVEAAIAWVDKCPHKNAWRVTDVLKVLQNPELLVDDVEV